MIPFLVVFFYSGFKWQVYEQQINLIDNIVKDSLYSATDLNKLRNYDNDFLDQELILYLIKYLAIDTKYNLDYELGLTITNKKPLAITVSISSIINNSSPSIQKTYIMDSTK